MRYILGLALGLLPCGLPASAQERHTLRIDLSGDNGRSDVLTKRMENWRVSHGRSSQFSVGALQFHLKTIRDTTDLQTDWWKTGLDLGATRASDGVTLVNPRLDEGIELSVHGLAPGRHSIVTWHSTWLEQGLAPMTVSIANTSVSQTLSAAIQSQHDDDAGLAYFEFQATEGQPVRIHITPGRTSSGNASNVVLCGFDLDVPDPRTRVRKPDPHDHDEHVDPSKTFTWAGPDHASYHVYFGTDPASTASADRSSPEFVGETEKPSYSPTDGLKAIFAKMDSHRPDWYWRVDTVDPQGRIHAGQVWRVRFRRLAFPGAEGYGRFAIGGRGGRVIEVTNLNDAGPGSLREAIDASGPRNVVFRVGGTIKLASKLVVRNPYLTVSGQTAPGDGICIRGYTFGCLGAHDVVLRHLRIRVGDEARETMDGTGFASCDHCIMDHCSISWSIDEGISSRGAGNITVQRCLVSEALNIADHRKYKEGTGHSFAASISGNVGSFHHNLLAHCAGRNWSLAGGLTRGGKFAGYLDLRNNVVYNWAHRTTDGGVKQLNFENNYYIPGPATRVFHFVKPDVGSETDPQQYFISGNRMEGRPQYDADNWGAGGVIMGDPQLLPRIRLTAPFCESYVASQSADECYENVMQDVGANFPKLDAHDQRIIQEVRQRTTTYRGSRGGLPGIIDTQTDVGGWPELSSGNAPDDADHDGLPDDYEKRTGLNPEDSADSQQAATSNGEWTNLEVYWHSLLEPRG